MSISVIEAVVLASACSVGACARYSIDTAVSARLRRHIGTPAARVGWAIMGINIVGSFLMGLVIGVTITAQATQGIHGTHSIGASASTGDWVMVAWLILAGVCGGFTTFSTAMVTIVRQLHRRDYVSALIDGAGTLIGALAACGSGIALYVALAA